MRSKRWLGLGGLLAVAGAALLFEGNRGDTAVAGPVPQARSAFKITFGLRNRFPNVAWAGGFRNLAQIRALSGWHLDTSDAIRPPAQWNITLRTAGRDIVPKGVLVDLLSPEEQPVTFFTRQGDFTFTPAEIPAGAVHYLPGTNQDVAIERVPVAQKVTSEAYEDDDPAVLRARDGTVWVAWVGYRTRVRDGFFYQGADEVFVSRSHDGRSWPRPLALTPPGDHFRVALGQDRQGRIWCVYGAQKNLESGDFNLYARVFDGREWSREQPLTSHPLPDIFHRLATDPQGNLYLVWMGYRTPAAGGAPQSDILMRVLSAQGWTEEIRVTDTPEDDWEPAVSVSSDGQAWIAWDAHRNATGYDLMLRDYRNGQLGRTQAVSETSFAEMRADIAVDGSGRVWVAWEEGPVNWAKDSGYDNPQIGARVRKGGSRIYGPNDTPTALYRRPRLAILEGGQLRQPRASLEQAYPPFLAAHLFQNPRLGVDGGGRVWLFLRHQAIARGRWAGHLFDYYATTLAGEAERQRWLTPLLVPGSTGRQDTVLAAAPGADGQLIVATVADGRRMPVTLPENHDVFCSVIDAGPPVTAPVLAAFQHSPDPHVPAPHPREVVEVERVRRHRLTLGGATYKILRGDLHRHTEISMDGAIDGSLWDAYRYALNAAALDFLAVTDHNYGAWLDTDEPETRNTDDEYQWWRTQKSADLFHVPGRFVPLYGYERSINFPLGHRNIFHPRRGVFSFRVPRLNISERPELIEQDAQGLWAYLRATGGLGIPHTSGTSMGTDWRLRDETVVPVTEIYQGDRNSYEEEGAPRVATPQFPGPGGAGRAPFQKGLIWNALGAGYRMGFIASSDHFTTHVSYANLLVPDRITTRDDIQQAFRLRRTYASTDNIILDFHTDAALQGDAISASASPSFQVRVIGTEPILRVDVVKNNRVIYTRKGDSNTLAFTFRDTAEFGGNFADTSMAATSQIKNWDTPETGIRPRPKAAESYYYVRVIQSFSEAERDAEGEIAWASPICVVREKR
jgi:hypothetical protein